MKPTRFHTETAYPFWPLPERSMSINTSTSRPTWYTSERRWVIGFAALIVLITTIPYLVGYATQGVDWRFSGFVFGVEDGNNYIAKMLTGTSGAWLFRTPYTAFPQNGILMYLPYILLGKLAAPPDLHDQLIALLQLFRITAVFLYVLASYDFLAFFVKDERLRRYGLALVTLGGGLGWLLAMLGYSEWLGSLPLDFISPESFGFLGVFGIAHLPLARALLLWTLLAYLKAASLETKDKLFYQGLKMGVLWLLAGLAQPLVAPVIGAVIGLHLVVMAAWQWLRKQRGQSTEWPTWRRLVRLAVVSGILPGLFVLYNLWAIWTDPYLRILSAQLIIRSPSPIHYLVAYGLILPFVFLGARRLLTAEPWKGWLLVAWVLAVPFLAYAPTNLQRRLPEGLWVALVTLGLCSVDGLRVFNPRRFKGFQFITLLAFPTTMLLFVGGLLAAMHPASPVFQPATEAAAFDSLAAASGWNAGNQPVVLSAYDTGNALPAWAPVRVVIGHGPESADLKQLQPEVRAFYSDITTDAARLEMIHRLDIEYIIWGPSERALGGWDPRQAPYLKVIEDNADYIALEVVQ
jgi:hypothetical protein